MALRARRRSQQTIAAQRTFERSGDHANAAMADRVQMFHGLGGRTVVVDVDARHTEGRAELTTIDHRRTKRGHGSDELRRDLRQPMAEKNEAVRFLAPQHQGVAFLAVGIVLGVANQHRITLALRRVFDALQDQREERIRDVRDHDQDFSRPSGAEVLGGGVRRVAEMFDRLEHPESGAGGHDFRAAEVRARPSQWRHRHASPRRECWTRAD